MTCSSDFPLQKTIQTEEFSQMVPRVSVVMSTYNAAAYLIEAIESILSQSFRDFEFLIHHDGSTDDSWKILTDYASRDRRIFLTKSENQGLPTTLNFLIGMARGDLIARMDADDISLLDRFSLQVDRF